MGRNTGEGKSKAVMAAFTPCNAALLAAA